MQQKSALKALFLLISFNILQPSIDRYCILQEILQKDLEYLEQQVVQSPILQFYQ